MSSSAAPNAAAARACSLVPSGAAARARCAAYSTPIRAVQAPAQAPSSLRWASPARMNRLRIWDQHHSGVTPLIPENDRYTE